MKNIKAITFMLVALMLFISLQAASAENVTDDALNANDNQIQLTVKTTSEEEVGSREIYVGSSTSGDGDGTFENPYSNLNLALQNSQDSTVISIRNGTYTGLSNTNLTVALNNVCIRSYNSETVIFDMENQSNIRAFQISASNVTLQGLTFINSKSGMNGGALYISGNNAVVDSCNFKDNTAANGGDIYDASSALSIINSTFSGENLATRPTSIYVSNGNLSVYNSSFSNYNWGFSSLIYHNGSQLNISNTAFSDCKNMASLPACVYTQNSEFAIDNCNFTRCSSSSSVGGIKATNSKGNVSNCNFNSSSGVNDAAALSLSGGPFEITYCNFTGAGYSPSYVVISADNSLVDHCYFEDLKVQSSHGGGGIYLLGENATITNVEMKNISDNAGSMIYVKGSNLKMENLTLDGSDTSEAPIHIESDNASLKKVSVYNVKTGEGAIHWYGNNASATECTFINCTCNSGNGGGIVYKKGTWGGVTYKQDYIMIDNCTFINCSSNGGSNSAVYSDGATTIITNSTFENCYGECAVHVISDNVLITNSSFEKCRTTSYSGGGILVSSGNATISECNFTECNAQGTGGAIYASGVSTIENCNFENNSAYSGGSISVWSGKSSINNCNFTDIDISGTGGAIENRASMSVDNCNFTNVHTTGDAGAILNYGSMTADSNTFDNCSARNGGAIYTTSSLTLTNSNFSNTEATSYGGAVYYQSGVMNMDNVSIANTTADKGGAIYTTGGGPTLNLNNITVDNASASNGGAIYNQVSIKLTNSTISNSNASENGGSIYNTASVTISDSSITGSGAGNNGGSIYNTGSAVISSSNIVNSTAGNNGGSVYSKGYSSITLSNITNSSAGANGGSFYVEGYMRVSNVTVNNSHAGNNGGTAYNNGTMSVTHDNIINSTASGHGQDYDNEGSIGIVEVILDTNTRYVLVNKETLVPIGLEDDNGNPIFVENFVGYVTDVNTGKSWPFSVVELENETTYMLITFDVVGTHVLVPSETSGHETIDPADRLTIIVVPYMPVNIQFDNITVHPGQIVDIEVNLTDGNSQLVKNGTVTTNINGIDYSAVVSNGKATFTNVQISLQAGIENIEVNYTAVDDEYYDNATQSGFINITKINTQIINTTITGFVYEDKTSCINVYDEDGNLIDGNVTIIFEDTSSRSVKIGDEFILTLPNEGSYILKVLFAETYLYNPSNGTVTLNVKKHSTYIVVDDITAYAGQSTNILVKIYDENDSAVLNGTLTLEISNVTYSAKVVLGMALFENVALKADAVSSNVVNGQSNFTVTLNAGQYIGEFNYLENDYYSSSSAENNINVIKSNTTTTSNDVKGKAKHSVDIKAKVVDDNGNPVKNGTATLVLDGKTYTGDVKNGVVTFKGVILPKSNTTAVIYYQGNDYYNASQTTINISIISSNNSSSDDKNGSSGNKSKGNSDNSHRVANIDSNATGNPIAVLMLSLVSIAVLKRKN